MFIHVQYVIHTVYIFFNCPFHFIVMMCVCEKLNMKLKSILIIFFTATCSYRITCAYVYSGMFALLDVTQEHNKEIKIMVTTANYCTCLFL